MSNEDTIRKNLEAFNRHDVEGLIEGYADNATIYDPQYQQGLRGRETARKDIQDFFKAFPDIQFRVDRIVASGNTVAVNGTASGTHKGEMEEPSGTVAPTNKRVEMRFAAFDTFDNDGKIVEEQRYMDMAGITVYGHGRDDDAAGPYGRLTAIGLKGGVKWPYT